MHSFVRLFTRTRVPTKPSRSFSPQTKVIANTMASATGGVTAALYAATFSAPTQSSAAPEDAKNLTHHNKHGKGFINPWASWTEASPWSIGYEIIRLVTPPLHLHARSTNTPPVAALKAPATSQTSHHQPSPSSSQTSSHPVSVMMPSAQLG